MCKMPLGASSCVDSLRGQIENALEDSISNLPFLPNERLDEIFTKAAISDAIKELQLTDNPIENSSLAKKVHSEGRRVFCMLLYNHWQSFILQFCNQGALDSSLPLQEDVANSILGPSEGKKLARREQWKFFPYVFAADMAEFHCMVDKRTVLPYTDCEEIDEGAFGIVTKMKIWPSQQHFIIPATSPVEVVRKELKCKDTREDFERERKCLRLLNELKHPNIVPMLGSYTYKGRDNFLFPYIGGNLKEFFKSETRHKDFQWDCTFYSALTGLASALSKTHRANFCETDQETPFETIGYHHDLRPPNVLVSNDTFVLVDFGFGSVKSAEELSHTTYKTISGDYVAPECKDMMEMPQTVNRAIDVWAFGCLMAEVVTYMIRGVRGIVTFREQRLTPGRLPNFKDSGFYDPQGRLKEEVRSWLLDLVSGSCDADVESSLIELSLRALHDSPQCRPTMDHIHERLATLSVRKHSDFTQDLLLKTCETGIASTPATKHRVENVRLAQKVMEGLSLQTFMDATNGARCDVPTMEEVVGIMKDILKTLREVLARIRLGDGEFLRSHDCRQIVEGAARIRRLFPQCEGTSQQPSLAELEVFEEREFADTRDSYGEIRAQLKEHGREFKERLPSSISWSDIPSMTSIKDFYIFAEDIQAVQRKQGELCNLARVRPYCQRLEEYTMTIGDIAQGEDELVVLLWGPFLYLLRRTIVLQQAFNALLNIVAEVGKALPRPETLKTKPGDSPDSQGILVLMYDNILKFYLDVFIFFSPPDWLSTFDILWPKQQRRMGEIICHMKRISLLIETGMHIEYIRQEQKLREDGLESLKHQEMQTRRQEFDRIKTSFSPSTYDAALYQIRGARLKGTENWLLRNKTYNEWVSNSTPENRVLWLRGIPGAGKTVVSSAIVDSLKILGRKRVFAFLTYKDEKATALSTIISFIFQLAGEDDRLKTLVLESLTEGLRNDLITAVGLLVAIINQTESVYIVVDGVDEMKSGERYRLVDQMMKMCESCERLRIFFSSRAEADLAILLEDKTMTIQAHEHNESSIQSYVDQRREELFRECLRGLTGMPKAQREAIKTNIRSLLAPIPQKAKGMFLYARIVMDMVDGMHDMSNIQRELKILPNTLDDAYYRIIMRFVTHPDANQANNARRLLAWVACTPEQLTVEEAQQGLAVKPGRGNRDQTFTPMRKLNVVLMLGPIVEVVDTYIQFVHFTVKEYVSSSHLGPKLIDTTEATLDLALRCMDYLCQGHHNPNLTPEELEGNIMSGQYLFHAFATKMWFELILQYLQSIDPDVLSKSLIEAIDVLWLIRSNKFDRERENQLGSEDELDDEEGTQHRSDDESEEEGADEDAGKLFSSVEPVLNALQKTHPLASQRLRSVSNYRRESYAFTGRMSEERTTKLQDPLSLSDISRSIQNSFEKLLCPSPNMMYGLDAKPCHDNCFSIIYFYGPRPFKCQFASCRFWRQGLPDTTTKRRHDESHSKPLRCHVSGCDFGQIGFLSESMRQRHIEEAHRREQQAFRINAQDISKEEIPAMIRALVQLDNFKAVEEILSGDERLLEKYGILAEVCELAASHATGPMLELIETQKGAYCAIPTLFAASIKHHNSDTLRYLLQSKGISRGHGMIDIIQEDWQEGIEIYISKMKVDSISSSEFDAVHLSRRGIFGVTTSHPEAEQRLIRILNEIQYRKFELSTLLKEVSKRGKLIALATFLLSCGADPNHTTSGSAYTALQMAVRNSTAESAEMIRLLLLHGADPERGIPIRKIREPSEIQRNKGEKIRDRKGAKEIQKWLGMTWDELVEYTKQEREGRQKLKAFTSQLSPIRRSPSSQVSDQVRLLSIAADQKRLALEAVMNNIIMTPEQLLEIGTSVLHMLSKMDKMERAINTWYDIKHDDERFKRFFWKRTQLIRQFEDGEGRTQLKSELSVSATDVDEIGHLLRSMARDLASAFPQYARTCSA